MNWFPSDKKISQYIHTAYERQSKVECGKEVRKELINVAAF
jgi:hypothetical protein